VFFRLDRRWVVACLSVFRFDNSCAAWLMRQG
jgi:hypothetical protein